MQKTAYEMRISDWSSDVCSSDLRRMREGSGMESSDLTPTRALDLWRRAVVEGVRADSPDLSSRQMAVLLTVYLTPPPHTVRGLAEGLNVSKPAITRSLDRLSAIGMLRPKHEESARTPGREHA